MKFTFYGHACFSIEVAGKTLLFDPFISPNPKAAHIDMAAIKADYILISHAHGDHIADAVALAEQTGAKCVSNYEIVNWLQAKGIENAHPMNHGGQWKFDFGNLKYVNAVHSSSFPDGSYGGHPGGFIIESVQGTLYYSGDTALTYDMKLWGKQHDIDMAILPIGDNFTMGFEDAAEAAVMLNVKQAIGVHFDTFGFIEIDHDAAKAAFEAKDVQLHTLEIGDSMKF